MATRRLIVARAGLAVVFGIASAGAADATSGPADADRAVRSALASGGYPWYDAARDAANPLAPPEIPDPPDDSPEIGLPTIAAGTWIVFAIMAVGLLGLIVYLARTWRIPTTQGLRATTITGPGGPSRSGALPAGLDGATDDPWAEALRRRQAGDTAGAIVGLFAHLMRTLERRGLVRLQPGRTARQLVRSIDDGPASAAVRPTLALFESAYYGRTAPTVEELERAWSAAVRWLDGPGKEGRR